MKRRTLFAALASFVAAPFIPKILQPTEKEINIVYVGGGGGYYSENRTNCDCDHTHTHAMYVSNVNHTHTLPRHTHVN